MNITADLIENETRRVLLVGYAKQLGIVIDSFNDSIGTIKEKIMAIVTPVKPGTAAPKASPPKPAAPAVAKPAAAPAPKPAPAAPAKAAAPAPKPAPAAAPKPANPPTKAAPTPVPAAKPVPTPAFVTTKEFQEFVDGITGFANDVQAAMEQLTAKVAELEGRINAPGGYGAATQAADGSVEFDLDAATEDQLRDLAWQTGLVDCNASVDDIKNGLRGKEWTAVNELPRPAADAPAEEEGTITVEQIEQMNWDQLVQLADGAGINYADISKPKQPKVLRTRIIEALSQAQAAEGGEQTNGVTLTAGASVMFEAEGATYSGVFQGVDEEGNYHVILEGQTDASVLTPDTELHIVS